MMEDWARPVLLLFVVRALLLLLPLLLEPHNGGPGSKDGAASPWFSALTGKHRLPLS